MWNFRHLRRRDLAAIAGLLFVFGIPFSLTASYLFGPSERVSSLLSSHFALSPDSLTALTMAVFCLTLGLFMFAGDRFLRRFLSR